jgi:hypothetical protein
MKYKILRICFLSCVGLSSAVAFSTEDYSCKGKKAADIQAKLLKRKKDVEGAMDSTVKLIQSLADSEMIAKRNFDISSSISYALIGTGVTGGVMGLGITAVSGGAASMSLRLGTYVGGSTLRTNTVGIGTQLLVGAAAGGGGRAWYLYDGKKSKIDVTALSYSYQPVKDKFFDPTERIFTEARTELSDLQKRMASENGSNSFFNTFNWNNEGELNKTRLNSLNAFFLLQLLSLEYQTIKKSDIYLSEHCDSETIYIDIDIKAEKNRIFESYRNLENVKLEDNLNIMRQQHKTQSPAAQ